MKEESLMKVGPFFEDLQHYENAMVFFKNIPIFDVDLNGHTKDYFI